MPEVGDHWRHLQGVDAHILERSSYLWAASNCFCARSGGAKADIYSTCFACFEADHDAKLLPVQKHALLPADEGWKAADIIDDPLGLAVEATEEADDVVVDNSQQVIQTTTARATQSFARSSPRRSCTSPYRGHGQRGRPPNGSRNGPRGFRGVRQRKGVRGYLVEIRPPRWKRTIWLGTYNSDREAAAAYDAGIFYTKKKTKYNFNVLAGTFPALPAGLRLDDADDHEEIKTFVQRQAREAARTIRIMRADAPAPAPVAAPATPEPSRERASRGSHPSDIQTTAATSTSASASSEESECAVAMAIPEDFLFTGTELPGMAELWDLDYDLDDIMATISLAPDFVPDEATLELMHLL